MRKKISIGFISLALLLLFAGVISVYELKRLSNQAMEVIELNNKNTKIAKSMLNGMHMQNSAVLAAAFNDSATLGNEYNLGRAMFDEAYLEASGTNNADIEAVSEASGSYREVVADYIGGNIENLTKEQFLASYLNAYYKLDQTIKNYLTSPASSAPARATSLEEDIYRTITPSILTLGVAIIIVLMFYFFVDSYYVRPVTKIYKSLSNNLSHHIPFDPHFESNNDELNGLREMIGELTEKKKR